MLGLCKLLPSSLCKQIQFKVSTDDYIVRNEVKNFDDTANYWHSAIDSNDNLTSRIPDRVRAVVERSASIGA